MLANASFPAAGPWLLPFLLFLSFCQQPDPSSPPVPRETAPYWDHPHLKLAERFQHDRDFDSANYHYRLAAGRFLKEQDGDRLLYCINQINFNYLESLPIHQAADSLRSLRAMALQFLDDNDWAWAGVYVNRGLHAHKSGALDSAIVFYQRALAINRRYDPDGQFTTTAHNLHRLGDVYMYGLSDYYQAEKYYEAALEIRTKASMVPYFDLFVSYYVLASLNRITGDHKRAQIFGSNALRVADKITENRSVYVGLCYNLLANINHEKAISSGDSADFNQAVSSYRQAIALQGHGKDKSSILSDYYLNLGAIYRNMAQFDSANANFFKALELKLSSNDYTPKDLSDIYLNLGWSYSGLGEFLEAKQYYDRCLRIREDENILPEIAEVYKDVGEMYQNFDSLDRSLQYYQRALALLSTGVQEDDIYSNPTARSPYHLQLVFQVMVAKAASLTERFARSQHLKDLQAALEVYRQADQLNDHYRNSGVYDESKLYLSNYFKADFEKAIEASYLLFQKTSDARYLKELFRFMEKDKYMLLFESLTKTRLHRNLGIPDSIMSRERALRDEVARIEQKLELESSKETPQMDSLNSYHETLLTLDRRLQQVKDQLATEYPSYYELQYDSISKDLSTVQENLARENTLLISYYWGGQWIYALGVTGKDVRVVRTKASQEATDHINEFLDQLVLNRGAQSRVDEFPSFLETGRALYKLLVEPLITSGNEKLIIIPDGPLSFLPFEALLTEDTPDGEVNYRDLPYLIKEYRIQYAYSANLQNHLVPGMSQRPRVLAFGDAGLTGASRELRAIDRVMKTRVYQGEQATESNFKSTAGAFEILHLAVHGLADQESLLNSKLLFQAGIQDPDDGELNVYELYSLELKAGLAVLSACETGIGRQLPGEGVYSMARAFTYAGCPSVIMSLWKLNDQSSAAIFEDFYQHLRQGTDSNEALHLAKIAYLNSQDDLTAHPSSWAALVSLGSTQWPPQKTSRGWVTLLVIVLVAATLVWIVYNKREKRT